MRFIENESGVFQIDEEDLLIHHEYNGITDPKGIALPRLIIPQGVKRIAAGLFERLTITGELSLPDSLEYIGYAEKGSGDCTFRGCHIPELVLPPKLNWYHSGGPFMNCRIDKLVIPYSPDRGYEYCRQFKEAGIGELQIAVEYKPLLVRLFQENYGYQCREITHPKYGPMLSVTQEGGYMDGEHLNLCIKGEIEWRRWQCNCEKA